MLTEFKMGLIWQEHKEHGKLSSMVNSVRAVILPEDIEEIPSQGPPLWCWFLSTVKVCLFTLFVRKEEINL